jgi:cystathionine beta-synthase
VVCILHDHGSRYVGKVYNDQWMMERGFLDVKTFKDIVSSRAHNKLITVAPEHTVAEAVELMKKYDIDQIPVMNGAGMVGSVSESGLFSKIFSNPELKNEKISSVMEHNFPVVAFDTPVERLSTMITKENGAVLSKDEAGNYHIVTKYDLIQSLTR